MLPYIPRLDIWLLDNPLYGYTRGQRVPAEWYSRDFAVSGNGYQYRSFDRCSYALFVGNILTNSDRRKLCVRYPIKHVCHFENDQPLVAREQLHDAPSFVLVKDFSGNPV